MSVENKTIPELTDGGPAQIGDQIPVSRSPYGTNDNYRVSPPAASLHVDYASDASPALASDYVLKQYVLPANTLATDGSYLRVSSFFSCAANTNGKIAQLCFDLASGYFSLSTTTSNDVLYMEMIVIRKSATTFKSICWGSTKNGTYAISIKDTTTDFTQAININVACTATDAADLTSQGFIVQAFLK